MLEVSLTGLDASGGSGLVGGSGLFCNENNMQNVIKKLQFL